MHQYFTVLCVNLVFIIYLDIKAVFFAMDQIRFNIWAKLTGMANDCFSKGKIEKNTYLRTNVPGIWFLDLNILQKFGFLHDFIWYLLGLKYALSRYLQYRL